MFTLRLFHQTDPARELAVRELADGQLGIGRDEDADWPLPDPGRTLSRRHCLVAVEDGELTVRDTSANGVYLGLQRLAPQQPVPVPPGEMLRLGDYLILVEPHGIARESGIHSDERRAFDAPFHRPILEDASPGPQALSVPSDWAAGAAEAGGPSDAFLLDAFCAGAGLDASAFAGETPEALMRRLGEVYRQMVLGLSDVMGDRTTVKSGYRMARTRVQAEENNPFKWAPPQRLAVDLLLAPEAGFLPASEAVKASFRDLKKHLVCMLAGMRAAIGGALEALSPKAVEASLESQPVLLRSKAAWAEHVRRHAEFRRRAEDDPDGPLNHAFARAYEDRLRQLDRLGDSYSGDRSVSASRRNQASPSAAAGVATTRR